MFSSETLDEHIEVGFFKNPTLFVCSVLFSVWEFIDKRISIYYQTEYIFSSETEMPVEDIRRSDGL